jgi:hypothetical protein
MNEDKAKLQQCIGPPNCGRIEMSASLRSMEYHPRYCIGSACKMAWRIIAQGDGYCGLAGKP